MKLYLGKPKKLIRLSIKRAGVKSCHLAFLDTSVAEAMEHIYHQVMPGVVSDYSYQHDDESTSLEFREHSTGKNGKSMSFSFEGVAPKHVHKKIVEHFGVNYQEYLKIKS